MSCLQYSSNITVLPQELVDITDHGLGVYDVVIMTCHETFLHYVSIALFNPVEEHVYIFKGSYFIFA